MADKKYKATSVLLNAEQAATVDEACEIFHKGNGIKLTRSQVITWIAYTYILKNQTPPQKGN
jgi:hypothetical protein